MNFRISQLNDDVLLLIFSYIHGEDALNVALASKRFYGLAIPAVAHEASCWEFRMIRQLCDYMLTPLDSQPRARYLRVLVILPAAFFVVQRKGRKSGTLSLYGAKSLITDVLGEASGLRVLRWTADFRDLFKSDSSRLTDVIKSWKHVTVLELNMVDDEIVSALRSVTTLRVLTLRDKALEIGQEHRGLPTLLQTLSQLIHLQTLSLTLFRGTDTPLGTAEGSRVTPRFPSIIDLSLDACSKSYFLLVQQCPNLSRLAVSYPVDMPPIGTLLPPANAGPRWPALQTLAISTRDMSLCGLYRLNTVRELRLWDTPFENSFVPTTLPLALPTLSPRSISIVACFRVENSPAWDVLANYQPGVRVLDIEVNPQTYRPWSDVWHDNVPKALNRLPLISLRLIVRSPSSSGTGVEAALDKPTRMQTTYRRKEAISSLPGKVFDAVPTLRVLAIAEEVDQIGRRPMAVGGASATPKARHLYMEDRTEDLPGWARHLEWGTLDRARFRLHWWYRASPQDEPMRVPEKEGERAYAAILRACTTATGEPASTADIEQLLASMSLE
ncbi:hypothetical protein VTO73DRAFT_9109 [Trametes versicolor]